MSKTVWVLTEEHNDYNQYGQYFKAVWEKKPTVKEIVVYFAKSMDVYHESPMSALDFAFHIEAGGGRKNTEDVWYYLDEVEVQ